MRDAEGGLDPDTFESWSDLCAGLRRLWTSAGEPSHRDLEKKAGRKGLTLSRSTLSRMLRGESRPAKIQVVNLLRTLGVDEVSLRGWDEAWDRIAAADFAAREAAIGARAEGVRVPGDVVDDATSSGEDLVHDVAADAIEVVRAVANRVRDEVLRDIAEATATLQTAIERVERLQASSEEATAKAKRDAAEIVKKANVEAKEVRERAKAAPAFSLPLSSYPASDPVIGTRYSDALARGASDLVARPSVSSALTLDPTGSSPSVPAKAGPAARQPSSRPAVEPEAAPSTGGGAADLRLDVGDSVRHEKYGSGIVSALDGKGSRATATVRFRNGESVRFMLAGHVPMTKVDE